MVFLLSVQNNYYTSHILYYLVVYILYYQEIQE